MSVFFVVLVVPFCIQVSLYFSLLSFASFLPSFVLVRDVERTLTSLCFATAKKEKGSFAKPKSCFLAAT